MAPAPLEASDLRPATAFPLFVRLVLLVASTFLVFLCILLLAELFLQLLGGSRFDGDQLLQALDLGQCLTSARRLSSLACRAA